MKSKISKIVLFLSCLAILLFILNEILKYKSNDGIDQMRAFYTNADNTIDVLFMGSSHTYSNINTGILYRDFGIAAFDLGGAEQLLWNNYNWLVEALKTQRPQVVVLEIFSTGVIKDDFQGAWLMENLYGMKPSENYYEAVKKSTLDTAFNSYILPFTRHHSRYTEIAEEDFEYEEYLKTFKGFEPKWGVQADQELIAPDIESVSEMTVISEKAERYYRKYIELCAQEGIPLLIICSPYQVTEDAQKIYNYMFSIAEEYDVPCLDFNKMYTELGLNFSTDLCEWSHLNEKGNVKYTAWLGNYLKEHYEIPDRREDKAYITWQQDADRWTQEYNQYVLPGVKDAGEYLKKLDNPYYTLIVTINEHNDFSRMSDSVKQELAGIGIDETALRQEIVVVKKDQILFQSAEEIYEWYTSFKKSDIIVSRELREKGGNTERKSKILINGEEYQHAQSPLGIIIYDHLLNKKIGIIGLTPEDGYSTIH
ncbi:MAG: hypothetical protein QM697_12350 [Lachnospiraceae bacterium]